MKFKRYICILKSYLKLKSLLLSLKIIKTSKKSNGMVYIIVWIEDAQVIDKLLALQSFAKRYTLYYSAEKDALCCGVEEDILYCGVEEDT